MTPLRTMFYGGLGALVVLVVAGMGLVVGGLGWWGVGRLRGAEAQASSFARYSVNDVIDHYDRHGLKTTPERPLTRDLYPTSVNIPRDHRSINVGDGSMRTAFVDIFAFDDEASLDTMWDHFAKRLSRGGAGAVNLNIARHENIMVLIYDTSAVYETLLYTMR